MVTLNSGDTAWVLVSAALVLLMTTPGLALFYGGLVRKKNMLSTMAHSFGAAVLVSVLWVVVQYSLAFSGDVGGWIGNLQKVFMRDVGVNQLFGTLPIPEISFSMFQMMFAIITVALISGAVAERMRFGAWMLFAACWSLLIYAPLAHWVWGGGWLGNGSVIGKMFGNPDMNALDFAGGLVVHISSGVSALVAAIYLGPRIRYGKDAMMPGNIVMTAIGAGLLWVGWFGFNAGSALAANGLAANAFMVTNTSAAMAGLTWMALEWLHHRKATVVGVSTGIVAGLVAITPAAGFVGIPAALVMGVGVSVVCYLFVAFIKKLLGYDDALDAFGVHGIGGIFGAIATGLFANPAIGTYLSGKPAIGAFYGNFAQLGVQLVSIGASIALAAVGTFVILVVINKIIPVRIEPQQEVYGLDLSLHGEVASSER